LSTISYVVSYLVPSKSSPGCTKIDPVGGTQPPKMAYVMEDKYMMKNTAPRRGDLYDDNYATVKHRG